MNIIRYCRRSTIVRISLLLLLTGYPNGLKAGVLEPLIQARKRAVQEEIRGVIQKAETLSKEGKYAETLRVLFDAMYTEQRIRLFLVKYSEEALECELDELFPITVGREITKVERQVIHEDPSPLLQWFRDPDVPLQEKFATLTELRNLASRTVQEGEKVLFLGTYQGILVQLMISPQLDLGEKTDVLSELRYLIQTEYTSTTQQDRTREEIARLRQEADQKFQVQQYAEAFILIDEADRKAREMRLYLVSRQEHDSLTKQIGHMIKAFVDADESPLMQVFKNRDIPVRKRQLLLYDLRKMKDPFKPDPDQIIFEGNTYDGTLVDILTHPRLDWVTKNTMLVIIDGKILKQEPDYLSDYLWVSDEEFMKLWEEHKKGTTKPEE